MIVIRCDKVRKDINTIQIKRHPSKISSDGWN
jgi:hypothetical protein